ncbi:MAG TPA: aspartate-semialdehyde dehydrogenase, partial [Nitrospiraceae bacterium]|nr:aspartate-semialdehyde dehydrogenase [Nitrospiraceae bacterium]
MLKKKEKYVVAVVGATGAVGNEMIAVLEERNFPIEKLRLFASERSEGNTFQFEGSEIPVETLNEDSFKGIDIALFSAGAERSKIWASIAAKSGCVVIDNSSQWRMDPEVPLVVPEVNAHDISRHKGIIANPNCSTIQMVVALKPVHDAARIKRVVVTTFQAVSGTGKKAMDELLQQTADLLNFKEIQKNVYPHQIAFNVLPQIDKFLENGYTKEEMKM